MSMNLKEMVEDLAPILGLDTPSTIVGSKEATAIKLLPIFNRAGKRVRQATAWPTLTREHSYTLADGQETYPLPGDFERIAAQTAWDNGNNWGLDGPLDGVDWQVYKKSYVKGGPRDRFRLWKWLDNKIHVDEIPGSTDAGTVHSFEYQSATWIRPQSWAASTSYSVNTRVWHNGNRYVATAGGTTSTTAPTHTSGSASDGGVSWDYVSDELQERFVSDTDVPLLDEDLVMLWVEWKYYAKYGPSDAVGPAREEYTNHLAECTARMKGARPIYLLGRGPQSNLGDASLSIGGWET